MLTALQTPILENKKDYSQHPLLFQLTEPFAATAKMHIHLWWPTLCIHSFKLTKQKSKLSDSNPLVFALEQITMTLYPKDKCHRVRD